MGIVFRQSIKTTIVTFAGAALGAAIVWVSTQILAQNQYGFVTNITLMGAVVQLLVIMGTANLISVYTQRYSYEDPRRKALLSIGLITTLLFSVIFTIIFLLLKEPIAGMYNAEDQILIRRYYHYIPIVVLLMALITIFDQYLIVHVKIAPSALAREVVLRLVNITLLVLVYLGAIQFHQYITGIVFMYLVPLIILIFISMRTKGFGLTTNLRVFSKAEYKDMIHFSWYHLLVGSTLTLLNFIDTLMLAPLDSSGMKATAIYGVAVVISSFMFMPYRAMATSSLPILNQAYINGDMAKVRDLFPRAGINILIAGIGMFAIIAVNLDNAVAILKPGYEPVKYLVLILMLGKLADMATGLNNELISISKFYKFNFRVSIILLVMVIVLDRIFIPQYGLYGAAWVATGTLVAFNVAKMIFLYLKLGMHPFTSKTWLVLLAGIIALVAGYVCPYIVNTVVDTMVRSSVVVAVYVLMLVWLKPSVDLQTYIASLKKDKRLF